MEFWGVEVKSGKSLSVEVEENSAVHLSQVCLVEGRDKGNDPIYLYVTINEQKIMLGTLSPKKLSQQHFDLVFDKSFKLSHSWKNGTVNFIGYKCENKDEESDLSDYGSDSDSGDIPLDLAEQIKDARAAAAQQKANLAGSKKDVKEDDSSDDSHEDSSEDEQDSDEVVRSDEKGEEEGDAEEGEKDVIVEAGRMSPAEGDPESDSLRVLAEQTRRDRIARKAQAEEGMKKKLEEVKAIQKAKKARVSWSASIGIVATAEGDLGGSGLRENVIAADPSMVVVEDRAVSGLPPMEGPMSSGEASSRGAGSAPPTPWMHKMPFQTPEEVMAATGVKCIMVAHPSVGMLALAALQQQTNEADHRGRDVASSMASAMTMIPQGFPMMNQCVYHQAQLTRSWAAKAESSAKQTEEARARADRAEALNASIEARRVEFSQARAEAEGALASLQAEVANLKDAARKTEAAVAERVRAAVQSQRLGEGNRGSRDAKDFNSFYVEGWTEAASFMRAGPEHSVWRLENIIVPAPEAPIPVVVPLSPGLFRTRRWMMT